MDKKYKRMLKGMLREEKKRAKLEKKEKWFLYILKCKNGTFYTGITKDLERRLEMHNDGKASKYTRTRRPVKLIYQETYLSRAQALVRECKIKAFPRKRKEKLIKQK